MRSLGALFFLSLLRLLLLDDMFPYYKNQEKTRRQYLLLSTSLSFSTTIISYSTNSQVQVCVLVCECVCVMINGKI